MEFVWLFAAQSQPIRLAASLSRAGEDARLSTNNRISGSGLQAASRLTTSNDDWPPFRPSTTP